KQFVFLDGPADRAAVLILAELALRTAELVREEIGCLKGVVANEVEGGSVKGIRSALGDDTDLASCLPAHVGRGSCRSHGEFLNRVGDSEVVDRRADLAIDVVDSVEQRIERPGTRSGGGDVSALTAGGRGGGSGSQERQRIVVAI